MSNSEKMEKKHSRRSRILYNKRKNRDTRNLVNKLLHNSAKKSSKRDIRRGFPRVKEKDSLPQPAVCNLKFGSINIDGLNLENCVEVENFLVQRDFDVIKKVIKISA